MTTRTYRPHPPATERFTPALRQALLTVEPAFFDWSAERQDRFRRSLSHASHEALERALGCTDPHDLRQLGTINPLKLPLFGIGADCFFLNDPGSRWYDMRTVADLSLDHYQRDPDREENRLPFMGQFYPLWCRYFRRDTLVYATLTAFHHYVYDRVDDLHDTRIGSLIPHRYVEGQDHGKQVENGNIVWDMRPDADGLEAPLKALQQHAYTIQNELYLRALADCHARNSGQVFRVVTSDGVDTNTHWVFDGLTAMQAVRLDHFLDDISALRASRRTLTVRVQPWLNEAQERLLGAYEDIMRDWKSGGAGPGAIDACDNPVSSP